MKPLRHRRVPTIGDRRRRRARCARCAAFVLLVLLCVGLASAQTNDSEQSLRIGYVDMARLLAEAPQISERRERIEAEFAERQRLLTAEQERLAELEQRQIDEGPLLGTRQLQELEAELLNLRRRVRQNRDALASDLLARSDAELVQLEADLGSAVREIAEREGYDLVLPSPVIYAAPRVDLTDRILARLRADHERRRGAARSADESP